MNSMIPGEISINLDDNSAPKRHPLTYLDALKPNCMFEKEPKSLHPFYIYLRSMKRICDKVTRAAGWYEKLLKGYKPALNPQDSNGCELLLNKSLLDYIELCFYVLAELKDNMKALIKTFYKSDKEYKRCKEAKSFLNFFEKGGGFDKIANYTNKVKHNQANVVLSFGVRVLNKDKCKDKYAFLAAMHFESNYVYEDGAVGPAPFMKEAGDPPVISLSTFFWNIIVLLNDTQESLCKFLEEIDVIDKEKLGSKVSIAWFNDMVIAVARLPIYSFDNKDCSLVKKITLCYHNSCCIERLSSGLLGSLLNQWPHIGHYSAICKPDDCINYLKFIPPKKLNLISIPLNLISIPVPPQTIDLNFKPVGTINF